MAESKGLRLAIYPGDQATLGPCECCGEMTSRVWGYIDDGEVAVAAYYVEWTPGHEGNGANFDLIVGRWGEDADASDRQAIALEFRRLESGPAFRVIDAKDRRVGASSLTAEALSRGSVVGTQLGDLVFAICDLIYLEDPRVSVLRE